MLKQQEARKGDRRSRVRTSALVCVIEDTDLGKCAGCRNHRDEGPYMRTDEGHLLLRCLGSKEQMVPPRKDIASNEKCPNYCRFLN